MNRLLNIIIALNIVAACAAGMAFAQVAYQKAERAVPPVVLVEKTVPDTAQICAQPEAGLVACRSVGEFRKWVRESKAK
jgi:hypothetical protein